jgi:hypothetical protein
VQQEENRITSKKVGLRPLAAPDILDFELPAGHICLISDDGSHISMELAASLRARGWRVVVVRYHLHHSQQALTHEERRVAFGDTPYVALTSDDEDYLHQQLGLIISSFGPVAAFMHVHPHFVATPQPSVTFEADSEGILRQVFMTAKYVHPTMTAAAKLPASGIRACFMTVTQLDGGFGLYKERDIDVIAGGLSGLTKTLSLEWPQVFCRAVDLDPDINKDTVRYILAELNDPNKRYTEVGWHKSGRVTPEVLQR